MRDIQAIIERVRRVNEHYQHVELAVDEALVRIKPGQSLLVRRANDGETPEVWHPYLREQWHPVMISGNKLVIERPAAMRYEPGEIISVLGPVGQPFRFRRTLRNVLLLAYHTPPTALLMTIPFLLANNVAVTLVLLGEAVHYATQHLPPEVEVLRGTPPAPKDQKPLTVEEELIWPNQVLTVGWADQVFAAVGQDDEMRRFYDVLAMLRRLRAEVPKNYLFGVFQPALACGVGACACCMIAAQGALHQVCMEGPAFDLSLVDFRV